MHHTPAIAPSTGKLLAAGVLAAAALTACSGSGTTDGTAGTTTETIAPAGSTPPAAATSPADTPGTEKNLPENNCAGVRAGDLIRRAAATIPDREQPDTDWYVAEDTVDPCGGSGYARLTRVPMELTGDDQFAADEERILFFDGATFAGMTPFGNSYSVIKDDSGDNVYTVYARGHCPDYTAAGQRYRVTVEGGSMTMDATDKNLDCNNELLLAPSGDLSDIGLQPTPRVNWLATYDNPDYSHPVQDEDFDGNDIGPELVNPDQPTEFFFGDPSGRVMCKTLGVPVTSDVSGMLNCRLTSPPTGAPSPSAAAHDCQSPDPQPGNPDMVYIMRGKVPCAMKADFPHEPPDAVAVLAEGQKIRTGNDYLCIGGTDSISCVLDGHGFTIGPDTLVVWNPRETY